MPARAQGCSSHSNWLQPADIVLVQPVQVLHEGWPLSSASSHLNFKKILASNEFIDDPLVHYTF